MVFIAVAMVLAAIKASFMLVWSDFRGMKEVYDLHGHGACWVSGRGQFHNPKDSGKTDGQRLQRQMQLWVDVLFNSALILYCLVSVTGMAIRLSTSSPEVVLQRQSGFGVGLLS